MALLHSIARIYRPVSRPLALCPVIWSRCSSGASDTARVHWFYATDVPKSKPPSFNYTPTKVPKVFEPFSAADSKRLEKAYLGHSTDTVKVRDDGLFEVHLDKREILPVYWLGPGYQVCRGLWFYADGSKLSPCDESFTKDLEELRIQCHNSSQRTFELDSGNIIKFSQDGESAMVLEKGSLSEKLNIGGTKLVRGFRSKALQAPKDEQSNEKTTDSDSTEAAQLTHSDHPDLIFRMADKVQRYLGTKGDSPDDSQDKETKKQMSEEYSTRQGNSKAREINHLILCVHGIGQKLSRKMESVNFVHDVNFFRQLLQKIRANNKVQVLPVLWRDLIKMETTKEEQERAVGKDVTDAPITLEEINLEGINNLRGIVGDVVLDIFLYYQPQYHETIIDTVVDCLNDTYHKFVENNESFAKDPKVSIIGHSLGSALCHDILEYHGDRLDFKVENLFSIGSPKGLFQMLRGKPLEMPQNIGALYNIFHPSDPIAYRMEPLIYRPASQLRPSLIPYTKGGLTTQIQELGELGMRLTSSATDVWKTIAKAWEQEKKSEIGGGKELEVERKEDFGKLDFKNKNDITEEVINTIREKLGTFNPHGRVDFSLQEGVLDISIIAAVASHLLYFEDEDVASFVLRAVQNEQENIQFDKEREAAKYNEESDNSLGD